MFDTHCHLNFKAFEGKVGEVIKRAQSAGVDYILVPGTDNETSIKAVEIANQYENVYAAVGYHPHHVNRIQNLEFRIKNGNLEFRINKFINDIKQLLNNKKVVAIGEVGLDKHEYKISKYANYLISNEIIELQKELLKAQIKLALEYDKSLILHNREAIDEFFGVIGEIWDKKLEGRTVFHCCEPDDRLLQFAIEHKIFIGIDGDVTYRKDKQEFIKKIPLDLLILETDAPYLVPEPLRSQKVFPNEPKNISIIAEFIAKIIDQPFDSAQGKIIDITTNNSKKLFFSAF